MRLSIFVIPKHESDSFLHSQNIVTVTKRDSNQIRRGDHKTTFESDPFFQSQNIEIL